MSDFDLRDPDVSRAYQDGFKAEPPAALDALILAAAHKEAQKPARPTVRIPWWRRALAPVGVFATLVVTVSVVLMVEQEQHDLLPASEPEPAPAALPAASPPVPAAAPSMPPPVQRDASRAMEPESAKSVAAEKRDESARVAAKPAPAPEDSRFVPAPAESAPGGNMDTELRERRAAQAPAASGATMERKAMQSEAAVAPSQPVLAAPAPAPAAPVAAPAPAPMRRELKAADKLETIKAPTEWIEEIRRLRRDGHEAEAQARLAAFRRAYPDYPLPDDLKGL